jgi:hypothetical protein
MKIGHEKGPLLVQEVFYPELLSRKCLHLLALLCWLPMILLGTTLLGLSTSSNAVTLAFCSDSQFFCTQNLLFNDSGTYHLYLVLSDFHQNNRMCSSLTQVHGRPQRGAAARGNRLNNPLW